MLLSLSFHHAVLVPTALFLLQQAHSCCMATYYCSYGKKIGTLPALEGGFIFPSPNIHRFRQDKKHMGRQ